MSKYYGKIGFRYSKETAPGVWTDVVDERAYYGEVLRNFRRWQNGMDLNKDLTISNEISIIADPFVLNNLAAIKYVEYGGSKWTVSSLEIRDVRLNLTLGGLYNG